VHDIQFGRLVRALRQRRRWRQQDLADRAGVGRTVIVDFEAGRLGGMRLDTQRQIAVALGFSMDVSPRGLGTDADRLLDQGHAVLMGATTKWLDGLGWRRVPEVSYSEWGERGSIDLLAWHEATATLLVIEIKTELVSVEATLRKLDEKVRLASRIALSRFGWRAEAASRLLVLPDVRSERRRVAAHGSVLDDAFPIRSYDARRWCRSPIGSVAALLFLPDEVGRGSRTSSGHVARVRVGHRTNVGFRRVTRGRGSR
jgi:transcriptional regulator with XRE-family HTH domain